jgi:hypothetical protein
MLLWDIYIQGRDVIDGKDADYQSPIILVYQNLSILIIIPSIVYITVVI